MSGLSGKKQINISPYHCILYFPHERICFWYISCVPYSKKKATDKDKIENCFTKQSSFNIDDIKCSSSTPNDMKEKTKDEIKKDLPTCKVSLFKFGAEGHNNESRGKTFQKKKDKTNDFKCDIFDYKAKNLIH